MTLVQTGTLISTWLTSPLVGPGSGYEIPEDCGTPVDPRGAIAIARMNWMHRKYPIVRRNVFTSFSRYNADGDLLQLNDDLKYNLALFAIEPVVRNLHMGMPVFRRPS